MTVKEPTALEIFGALSGADGQPLSLADFAHPAPPPVVPPLGTLVVVGSSMNAGKTTTVVSIIRGLSQAGLVVGAGKVTGSGSGKDRWAYIDAGAEITADFLDYGLPSTFGYPREQIGQTVAAIRHRLAAEGAEVVVLEIADGVLQCETAWLLQRLVGVADAVVFAAVDPLSACLGVQMLRQHGLPVRAVSGLVTRSPLASREVNTGVPLLSATDLAAGGRWACWLHRGGRSMQARVWHPDGTAGPGGLREVDLPVLEVQESGLVLAGLRVLDARGGELFAGPDLCFDHAWGGGPLAAREAARQARAFGVVNVAYHLRRGLDYLAQLLGHPLPPLTAKTGMHVEQRTTWGGAHYRLPTVRYQDLHYQDLPEREPVAPTGEIHFGPGGRFIALGEQRYFHEPAHNAAIIYHELGHHLCRHTADFRLNRRHLPRAQSNRKVPLDEGTCDYMTAVLLGTPDIFGWQRAGYPRTSQQRRCLDGSWTMSSFWGPGSVHMRWGEGTDPHIDGTVWSAALWATRTALVEHGVRGEVFDRLVVQALVRLGPAERNTPRLEALRNRGRFSRFLQALVDADHACGTGCSAVILRTMAQRGILPGYSNEDLRDRARHGLVEAAV